MFNKRICLTYNSNSYKLTVVKFRLSLRRLNLVNDTGHIYPAWLIKGWRQAPATWSERHLSPSVSSSTSSRKKISGKMKRIFNLQLLKKGGWKNRAKKKRVEQCASISCRKDRWHRVRIAWMTMYVNALISRVTSLQKGTILQSENNSIQ